MNWTSVEPLSKRCSRKRLHRLLTILLIWGAANWVDVSAQATQEDPNENETVIPLKGGPFFVVSTVDGSIGVLRAIDGSLVNGFRCGSPLVTPSEVLTGGRRIVPGLDGRLYLSLEEQEGILQPLEITILDVLQTPVKTCSRGGTNCGIVTATKSTSLFALDSAEGRLVWKQATNGTTTVEVQNDDDDDEETTSTVLLQREDVLVQQLSTDSGKSVWNCTLGTVQALEFGEDVSATEGSLPVGSGGPYLPSTKASESRQLLMSDFLRGMELPSVVFGSDGTSLMAVTETKDGDFHVLWSREFPTVVASVFGLQDRTWKPLTVLENPMSSNSGNDDEDGRTPPLIGGEPTTREPLAIYEPSVLRRLFLLGSIPMSFLDRITNAWYIATGQPRLHPRRQHSPWKPLSAPSNQLTIPRRHTLAPLLPYDDLFLPPRLALPAPPSGVYLTWPFLIGSLVVTLGLSAIVFRSLYLQKKTKWLQLVQQMASVGLLGGNFAGQTETIDLDSTETKPLKRSRSLPDVAAVGNVGEPIETTRVRRLRSESLQISHTVDGRLVYDKQLMTHSKNAETRDTSANTSNLQTSLSQDQQPQGVGFLVDGIPLIRYNRYASEFSEMISLGKGGFGTVFRCKNVLDGREYAIKKVSLKYKEGLPLEEFRQRLQRTLREVKSLALLDHPNIVRYYTAWLELQQQEAGKTPSQTDGSQRPSDSDYYLFSPSNTQNITIGLATKIHSIGQIDGNSAKYFHDELDKRDNPLCWNAFEDSSKGNSLEGRHLQGVPTALDDYGFTFDRGDEETSSPDTVTIHSGAKSIAAASKPTLEENAKNLEFHPYGPTVHRYSQHNSNDGQDSSIEGSVSNVASAWSISDRRSRPYDSSTGEEPPQSQKSDLVPAMVRHILYIQMQFCSQKTLADFLRNSEARQGGEIVGRVDVPYALSLFLQIAQGVEHVHSQGLIHRDLKPNNCFIDDSGVVKVGDFGLSRESANDNREGFETIEELDDNGESISDDQNVREITAGVGTRSYASPEQMEGSDYDSSTDIYSLGIMLFELCYPMYTGMERTIVLSKLRNHIFPQEWIDSVKVAFPTLHSLLESMISHEPSDRPSAAIVVQSIRGILEGFTISSIDKRHIFDNAILLRVEAKPREDVLRHTMNLVKEAANPDMIEFVQYGLRGGTTKAVMEFAISSAEGSDQSCLGNTLVAKLGECEEILLIRQVSGTKYTYSS